MAISLPILGSQLRGATQGFISRWGWHPVCLFLIVGFAFALRMALVENHPGYLGVDTGAYLTGWLATLGNDVTGAGFPRPPLAPGLQLSPFIAIWGYDDGTKYWSVMASLLPMVPVFFITRTLLGRWPALFAVFFISIDLMHGEMFVTGALPLMDFAFLGMVWWAMGSLAERWSWRTSAVLVVCLGLIPYVNQTTAGLAVVTIPVYGAALLWYNKRQWASETVTRWAHNPENRVQLPGPQPNNFDNPLVSAPARMAMPSWGTQCLRLGIPLFVGGLIALGALPWYLKVLPGSELLHYPGPWIYVSWQFVAWVVFAFSIPLGVWVARKAVNPAMRSFGILVIVLATLSLFLSNDETLINIFYRSKYLLALPFYVCVTWAVFTQMGPWVVREFGGNIGKPLLGKVLVTTGTLVAIIVFSYGYSFQFNNQSRYSDMIIPSTADALVYLQENDPAEGIITNSFSMSLWVTALNQVPSPHTWNSEPPRAYTETDKDVRCLLGWVGGCDPKAASERLGVGYVLIDTRFPYYKEGAMGIYLAPDVPPEQVWDATARAEWLTVLPTASSTMLWRIDG